MNRNVNYLYKRSGLLTDYFILSMFWVRGGLVRTPRTPPPSYGPDKDVVNVPFPDKGLEVVWTVVE